MTAILKLHTTNHQVFDLGYGSIILNRNSETIDSKKYFKNVFMQGEESNDFLKEVDSILSKKIKNETIDHWLFGYSEVMDILLEEDLNKIGVTISKKRNKQINK